MRTLPDGFCEGSSLCTAWLLRRRDGAALGFTDHDRPLVVAGVACEAASGWTAGAADAALGFPAGTMTALGALGGEGLDEADVARGLYDGAEVEAWRVDWNDPVRRVRLWRGTVRRLVRAGAGFTAEIEGPAAALERTAGRTFARGCDAVLGDARCGFAVGSAPGFSAAGTVSAVGDNRRLTVGGLGGFPRRWFAGGRLLFTSGDAAGEPLVVALHETGLVGVVLDLEAAPLGVVAPGDGFTVQAGCDKRWETCGDKFDNAPNFRGFPDIPGDDWLAAVPVEGGRNDGGSRR